MKQIFMFALPMLVGNIFQQLYNIVDSVIVGRFLGKEALASVGASFPVIFTLIAFIIGIGGGFTIVISQYFGAKDVKNVTRSIDTMLIALFVASIIITFMGITFSSDIFRLLQLPDNLIPKASLYLNTYLSGTLMFCGFNSVSSTLRGLGDSKTPLMFLIISTVSNIILDILFVVGFKWGIFGAAFATVISQGISFITAVVYLNRTHKVIHIRLTNLQYSSTILKHAFRIGLPTGFQQTFVALGMMAIMSIVNRFGTNVIAAYSAATRIDGIATLPAMNFSQALAAFVGQNLGANKIDRIRKGFKSTLIMSTSLCIAISLMIVIFGSSLMRMFSTDPEVISIGKEYLVVVSSFYFIFSMMFSTNGLLRGAGDTLIPMFITLVSLWIVRVPIAYFFSSFMGESGIWWSVPAGWSIGLIASFTYYKTGRWKTKGIIKYQQ